VFCRHRVPAENSRLVATARDIPLLLIVGQSVDSRQLSRLESLGVKLINTDTDDPSEMVNKGLDQMGQLGMTNVLLEGGGELLASFFNASQIDECHVYVGPRAVGGSRAPGPIGGDGIGSLDDAPRFRVDSVTRFDDDVKIVYRRVF